MFSRKVRLVAALSLIAAIPPVEAQAVSVLYSRYDVNFTVNTSTGREVRACDRNNNGYWIEGNAQWIGSGTIYRWADPWEESNPTACTGITGSTVYRHRVVEDHVYDKTGDWVYPR